MLVRDFIEPATVLPEGSTLADALPSLAADIPVFVRVSDVWHTLDPRELIGYPISRRLIDVPLARAICLSPDADIEAVLESDATVVGVEERGVMIGRVDRHVVQGEIAMSADPAQLGYQLQSRALPALLHDLANSLLVAEMAVSAGAAGEPETLAAAHVALHHAGALVLRMRSLTASEPDRPQPVDAGAVLREMQPLLQLVVGHEIVLTLDAPASTPPMLGYRRLIERAVLNLVINARDALGWAGRIRVSLARTGHDPSGTIEILVEDDGPGIDAAIASRIFEAGVTTKRGTARGIGLSSVRRALQRVSGAIEIVPSSLGGAAFRLLLPVARG